MKHWDMTMRESIAWWDTIDKGGTSLAGIRALCLVDRYYLLVKVCRRIDMLHPWIYARCRDVERDPEGRIDLWAREHYKSTIITFGGAIQSILNNPEITIGIFSHVGAIASAFLKQIKTELESNETLKKAFPDILYEFPQKEAKQWSVEGGITVKRKSNPKESTVESSGLVDGQPVSKHYELRIYDDVVTDRSVSTPDQVQKTTDAYSLSQSLGKAGGSEWMIGTRYSHADTYNWILERGALKPRIYQATEDGTKDGDPVFFTADEWRKRKLKNTDSDIACQYLQDPLQGSAKMFDANKLGVYEVRPAVLNVYIVVDPARSKKKGSAHTAIMVWGLDYAMNKYLLDGFDHKMDLGERWQFLARTWLRWKGAAGVQNVKVGYESFGAQADMDYFVEQMRMPGAPKFDISELQWPQDTEGSKQDRVQRLVPDLNGGKLFLPYPTDEHKLTKLQRKMMETGYEYRISRNLKRKNEDGMIYDLAENLRTQFSFFPFCALKDAIDATARIYDMEPRAPTFDEARYAEPEFT